MNRSRLFLLGLICLASGALQAQTSVMLKINGVRNNKGQVLAMAQADKESKPIFAMARASQDTVSIVLENVEWEQFKISVFHDENSNYQLERNENGSPAEGYVLKSINLKKEKASFKLILYYPESQ